MSGDRMNAKLYMIMFVVIVSASFASAGYLEDNCQHWNFNLPGNLTAGRAEDLNPASNYDLYNYTTVTVAGKMGTAIDYSNAPYMYAGNVYNITTEDVSVCAWIWSDSITNADLAITLSGVAGPQIAHQSNSFRWGDTGGFITGPTLATGRWYHLCGVRNSSEAMGNNQLYYFLNGTRIAGTASGTFNGFEDDTTNMSVGGGQHPVTRTYEKFLDGKIDEVWVCNVALTPANVTVIYSGYNYSLGGASGPAVTVEYPEETVSYNASWNRSIVLSTNIASTCTINYTHTKKSNGTSHTFLISSTPDGTYTVAYACNVSTAWTNSSFWFFYDGNSPTSVLYSPLSGSYHYGNVRVNTTFSDPYLYAVNVTITNSTKAILYSYSSGAIINGSTTIRVSDLVDISTIPNGTVLTLFREATDSHTANIFDEPIEEIKDTKAAEYNKITYRLPYTDFIVEYPKDVAIKSIKETDRYSFEYTSTKIGETYFDISAEKLVHLKNSEYQGHFVIYANGQPKYWFDTEGLDHTRTERLDEHKYRIYYYQSQEIEKSRSLGGLNYQNWTTSFYVGLGSQSKVRIEVNNSANDFLGYANLSYFEQNFNYEYTWFLNGVNISSGVYGSGAFTNATFDNGYSYYYNGTWDPAGPATNGYDNNYTTMAYCAYTFANCYIYMNYTVNSSIFKFVWTVQGYYTGGITNLSIELPDMCRIGDVAQLRVNSKAGSTPLPAYSTTYSCYNGTGWYELGVLGRATAPGRIFYEESVNKIYSTYANYSGQDLHISTLPAASRGELIFSARQTNGTHVSPWYNSSSLTFPQLNLTIYNEMNISRMDIDNIDEVRLDIFCENRTQRIRINDSFTSLYPACAWEYMNLWFVYNATSYYRTLVPSYGVTSPIYATADFYMIDLFNKTAVLWDVKLLDLVGEYLGQPFFVTKLTDNNGTIEIIKQFGDIQNYVHLYLIKDETYALNIISTDGRQRVIGNIEASEAATKVATLPRITFKPEYYLSDDISLDVDYEPQNGILRITYVDAESFTESVRIEVYNGSDLSLIDIYNTTSNDFTYGLTITENQSYVVDLTVCHAYLGCSINDRRSYGFTIPSVPDFSWMFATNTSMAKAKKIGGLFIVGGTALIFPARFVVVGLVAVLVELAILPRFGMLEYNTFTYSLFMILLAVSAIRWVIQKR